MATDQLRTFLKAGHVSRVNFYSLFQLHTEPRVENTNKKWRDRLIILSVPPDANC